MTPDGSAEKTTAAEREGVGVEKFATVGGLAEWRKTLALTRGAEQFVRKVRNSWVFAPPLTNVDGAAAVAHRHHHSCQDPAVPGSNPAKKVFQTFQLFPFQGIRRSFPEVTGRNKVSNGWHE